MLTSGAIDVIWWITVVEIPALMGLFWLILRTRSEMDSKLDRIKQITHQAEDKLWSALNAYKLDVAKTYAPIQTLKDVEHRLTGHLVRIEDKLDGFFHPNSSGGSSYD